MRVVGRQGVPVGFVTSMGGGKSKLCKTRFDSRRVLTRHPKRFWLLFSLKLSQHRYAAQLAARLRQHPPITTLVGILSAGRLHLGVGGRVLLVVICIRDDAAGQVALRGGQADPRPLAMLRITPSKSLDCPHGGC